MKFEEFIDHWQAVLDDGFHALMSRSALDGRPRLMTVAEFIAHRSSRREAGAPNRARRAP